MFSWISARLGILERLRAAWKQDIRRQTDPLRGDLKDLIRSVDAVQASLTQAVDGLRAEMKDVSERQTRAEQRAAQLRQIVLWNEKHHELLADLPRLLDPSRVIPHVRAAIERAPIHLDPFPHAVVEELFPWDVYETVLRAIPPSTFFSGEATKQNLRLPIDDGPALTCRVWTFVDGVVARDGIVPAIIEKFKEPLRAHYATVFGPAHRDRAEAMPQAASGGRVMLRRAGYYLAPHRDPKRSMVTCLLYLARSTDQEQFGTEIYRVSDDRESSYMQTFYPEQHGSRCELVRVIPYRPNSMLVFVNANGAHGARIPADAPPGLERYSYQFYVGPGPETLSDLIADLPADRKAMWHERKQGALLAATS
jgi:hypothetical protein